MNVMLDSEVTELLALISMNVLSVLITVIPMQVAETTLVHSLVNVKMDIKVMVLHVPMLTNVLMGTIGATSTLLVPTLLEAMNVNVTLDTMVTVSIAVTSTNALKVSVTSMQNAKILLAHFHAHVIMDILVMVFHVLTSTNAPQMVTTVTSTQDVLTPLAALSVIVMTVTRVME